MNTPSSLTSLLLLLTISPLPFCLRAQTSPDKSGPSLGETARKLRETQSAQKAVLSEKLVQDGLKADDDTDVRAFNKYKEAIWSLLEQERFDELDRIADENRSRKLRFSGGVWKLALFYFTFIDHPVTNWNLHLQRLQKWVQAKPESISARVALAGGYIGYAGDARGGGYSETVTESGWKLFFERLALARKTLEGAEALPQKCPHGYDEMLILARLQQWSPEEAQTLFDRAIAFEPLYYSYYRERADYLLPRWYGEPGEVGRFASQVSSRIKDKEGAIIYFEIAQEVARQFGDPEEFTKAGLSWPKIQEGFAALTALHGKSLVKMNQFAQMAIQSGELGTAHTLFDEIGEEWDPNVWQERSTFDRYKNRAASYPKKQLSSSN